MGDDGDIYEVVAFDVGIAFEADQRAIRVCEVAEERFEGVAGCAGDQGGGEGRGVPRNLEERKARAHDYCGQRDVSGEKLSARGNAAGQRANCATRCRGAEDGTYLRSFGREFVVGERDRMEA